MDGGWPVWTVLEVLSMGVLASSVRVSRLKLLPQFPGAPGFSWSAS